MHLIDACVFSPIIACTTLYVIFGNTSKTYSGLNLLVLFVMIIDNDLFSKCITLSLLSDLPKYNGNQCVYG